MFAVFILNRISCFPSRRPDFLDSCRANTLLAELDDEEDLPEPDDDDDENEDDNQEDQEYEEVLVMQLCYFCIVFPWRASAGVDERVTCLHPAGGGGVRDQRRSQEDLGR